MDNIDVNLADKEKPNKKEVSTNFASGADCPDINTNASLRSFSSSFASKPIASSSPLAYSNLQIQQLKALMPQDLDRTPYARKHKNGVNLKAKLRLRSGRYNKFTRKAIARSEPSAIDQSGMKPASETYSSGSEREEGAGILKKTKENSPEKSSPSGSAKDIKVFQSGGVLILQNFKDSSEEAGKKALSEISSKLIEDCHKLGEELREEPKEGRSVQFDLTPSAAESPSESLKISREQPSSLSTNESMSWQPGGLSSPSSSTCARRLEWDSGADVGYSEKDMSKEKMSTLERQALQGFNPLGKVVTARRGDYVLRRIPSDVIEVDERHSSVSVKDAATDPHIVAGHPILSRRSTSDSNRTAEETETTLRPDSERSFEQIQEEKTKTKKVGNSNKENRHTVKVMKSPRQKGRSKEKKVKNSSSESSADATRSQNAKGRQTEIIKAGSKNDSNLPEVRPEMKDHSASVNTLGAEFGFYKLSSSGSSNPPNCEKLSPRTKKLKKKKPPEMSVRSRKIKEIIDIALTFPQSDETECRLEEITVDHSFHEENPNIRPISASSGSNKTVLPKQTEEKTVQTSFREGESKAVQAEPKFKRTTSKNIQASGELNSLPKHLDVHQFFETSGGVRTKSTQFFGDGVNSLPRGLSHGQRNVSKNKESPKKLVKKKVADEIKKENSGLTVEVLRQRREVADPKIIQEKFFESQRRIMISKSTSMESRNVVSAGTSMEEPEQTKMVSVSTSINKSKLTNHKEMESTSTSMDKSKVAQHKAMISASTSIDKSQLPHRKDMVSASTSMDRKWSSQMEPKQMVSASTSMDQLFGGAKDGDVVKEEKNVNSVGVQYSPVNVTKRSEVQNDSRDARISDGQQHVRDAWTDTLDSQASSTQTAHSWVHGGAPLRDSVVRTTRSFEYLPGEVYESSGNLREKLPSDASRNVITESSSSADSDVAPAPIHRHAISDCETNPGGDGVPSLAISENTLVIDDSQPATPAAWVLVAGGASNQVRIIKRTIDPPANENAGTSDGSEQTFSDYNNEPLHHEQKIRPPLPKPGRKSKNQESEQSRCSAGVQTENLRETSIQKRDSDLLQVFRRIEQFLVSQSHSRPEVQSLDRDSSKAGKTSGIETGASLKTSTSLQSSPQRRRGSSIRQVEELSVDGIGNNTPIPARASSTPKLSPAVSEDHCMKLSSENESALNSVVNSGTSSVRNSSFFAAAGETSAQETNHEFSETREILERNSKKDTETQMTLQHCICSHQPPPPPPRVDQATQMSLRHYPLHSSPRDATTCRACKKRPCVCQLASTARSSLNDPCEQCKKTRCVCRETHSARSAQNNQCVHCKKCPCVCGQVHSTRFAENHSCVNCKKRDCVCPQVKTDRSSKAEIGGRNEKCLECKMLRCACRKQDRSSSSSDKQFKVINGEVFGTYLDVDFSSSEALPSSTSTSGKVTFNDGTKKKHDQCSVCRCVASATQACVFCVCHIDKRAHIPRCDCHDKIPRFLIPGFCKCHRRNLRHFDKCRCSVETEIVDGVCPCCQYFALRMRAQLLEAQLEQRQPANKSKKPPPQPKNYFLKLEETEISKDSSEISEQEKEPLEVVTIKIPVKRMGKAKVPTQQFYYGGDCQKMPAESRRSRTDVETAASSRRHDKDIEYLDDIIKKYLLSSRRSDSQSRYSKDENLSSKRRDMTRSDKESGGGRSSASYRTLQECLESNRPDFFSSAEYRRKVIGEKARERELRKQKSLPMNLPSVTSQTQAPKRIFSTSELRAQSRKKCKQLSEVTKKKEERKKRELYQTNKIMAEIFAKRLQLKTLRGQLNISNSCNLLAA